MAFKTLKKDEVLNDVLVVDNSVMMRWLFQDGSESDQNYARAVLEAINSKDWQIIVPYIWVYESAFVVNYYVKQNAKLDVECLEQLKWLFDLSTVIRGEENPVGLFEFSQANGISAYDASYALLALNQACPIATLDKRIVKTAEKAKYSLFKLE